MSTSLLMPSSGVLSRRSSGRRTSLRFAGASPAGFDPSDLDSLFALFSADSVSDQTLVEDTFTDADSTALSAHTSDSGHAWTSDLEAPDTINISGNKVVNGGRSTYSISLVSAVADGVVSMDVTLGASSGGSEYVVALCRSIDKSNWLGFRLQWNSAGNDALIFVKEDAGSVVSLATASPAPALTNGETYTLRMSFHADRLKGWLHLASETVDYSTTDPDLEHTLSGADYTTYGTRTGCGLAFFNGDTISVDNFSVSTLDQTADHTVAYDSFTRANNDALGSTEVGGFAWTEDGDWDIDGNQLRCSNNAVSMAYFDCGITRGVYETTITSAGGNNTVGFVFAADGTGTSGDYLRVSLNDASGLYLFKVVAGSATTLASDSGPIAAGTQTLRAAYLEGGRILVWLDGVLYFDYTLSAGDDTTFGSNTNCGSFGSSASPDTWDNFRVRRLTRLPVWPDTSRTGTDRVNANHAVNTTEARQPVLVEDWHSAGVATVMFDGTDDYLRTATYADIAQPFTFHIVGAERTSGDAEALVGMKSSTLNGLYDGIGDGWNMDAGTARNTGHSSDQQNHLHVVTFNAASSTHVMDGSSSSPASGPGSNATNQITIGATGNATYSVDGEVSTLALESDATTQAADMLSWSQSTYSTP